MRVLLPPQPSADFPVVTPNITSSDASVEIEFGERHLEPLYAPLVPQGLSSDTVPGRRVDASDHVHVAADEIGAGRIPASGHDHVLVGRERCLQSGEDAAERRRQLARGGPIAVDGLSGHLGQPLPTAAGDVLVRVAIDAEFAGRDAGLLVELRERLLDQGRPERAVAVLEIQRRPGIKVSAVRHFRQLVVDRDVVGLPIDLELDGIGSVRVLADHVFDRRRVLQRDLPDRRQEVAVAEVALVDVARRGSRIIVGRE